MKKEVLDEKNLSREGGKKFVYNACQRSTVIWQRIFSLRTSEWTWGCSKAFFIEINCYLCGEIVTLCDILGLETLKQQLVQATG